MDKRNNLPQCEPGSRRPVCPLEHDRIVTLHLEESRQRWSRDAGADDKDTSGSHDTRDRGWRMGRGREMKVVLSALAKGGIYRRGWRQSS